MSNERVHSRVPRRSWRRRAAVGGTLASVCALAVAFSMVVAPSAPAASSGAMGISSIVEPTSVTSGGKIKWTITVFNVDEYETSLTNVSVNAFTSPGVFDLKSMKTLNGDNLCEELESELSILAETTSSTLPPPPDGPTQLTCALPDIPPGGTFDLFLVIDSTGVAPFSTIFLDAFADANEGFGDVHDQVNVEPNQPDHVTAYVPPGGQVNTGTVPTVDDPLVTQVKLPKKVNEATINPLTAAASPKPKNVPGPGAVVTIDETDPSTDATFCDNAECIGQLTTISDFPHYNDPKHPASIIITWFDASVDADSILYVKKPGDVVASVVPKCIKDHGAYTNTPCLKKHKKKKGFWQSTVFFLSGDPTFGRR